MEDAVKLKQARFKTCKKNLVRAGQAGEAKFAKEDYSDAKSIAKRAVWQAIAKAEEDTFVNISPNDSSIFNVAKHIDRTNQDVVGKKCTRNDTGEFSLSDEDKMKVRKTARIRNRYDQVLHLSQDTKWESNKTTINITNKSQWVSPFPSGDHKMDACIEHYAGLFNVEFEWPIDLLPEVAPVEGSSPATHSGSYLEHLAK